MNSFFTLAVTKTQDKSMEDMAYALHELQEMLLKMVSMLLVPILIISIVSVVFHFIEKWNENPKKALEDEKLEHQNEDSRTRIVMEEDSVEHLKMVESWDRMVEGLHASPELKSQTVEKVQETQELLENRSIEEIVLDTIIASDVASKEMKERAEKLLPHFLTPTQEEIQLQNEQNAIELDLVTLERIVEARAQMSELENVISKQKKEQ